MNIMIGVWEESGYLRNGIPYVCVHFSTSASCHEMPDTVYSEAKLISKGEL